MKKEAYKIVKSDVLVIGSGGAGLRCAIELKDKGVDVQVVGKCKKREAHTSWATGGINAAFGNLDKKDSWQLHAADTIRDGEHINDTDSVLYLCKDAPRAVRELAKWGCPFHKEKNGKITQRFFGAATYRRACFVGDHTGKAILDTLVDQTIKRKIKFASEVYIFSLLEKKGRVCGAVGIDMKSGKFIVFRNKAVVLATGGHSRMFKRCSSHFWENNGDGIYLAREAGAKFMDMEMFQFHPTGMVWPKEAEGLLVTEAVRGEGGILTNSKGERFMENYDKERMELSARDIVARANYNEIKQERGTKKGGVYLDISMKSKDYILKRLPKMYQQFKDYTGIDISKHKMEVAPTAHYSMGGIFVDHLTGKTDVLGLYAVGEVTAGAHGGNRLGGNSLAEICVFGRLTGQKIAKDLKGLKLLDLDEKQVDLRIYEIERILHHRKGRDPIAVKREIQQMMQRHVGVIRNANDMKRGLKLLDKFRRMSLGVHGSLKMNEKLIAALDIRNMIPTCEMILLSALHRKESRAAHFRSDYPKISKRWQKNIICSTSKKGDIKLTTRVVKKVPKEVAKLIKKRVVDSHEHHALE